jgi:hypothetical protein
MPGEYAQGRGSAGSSEATTCATRDGRGLSASPGITVKRGCIAVFQLGGSTVANGYSNGTNSCNGAGTAFGSNGAGANGSNGNQPDYFPNGNNANGARNSGANADNRSP